MRKRNNRTKARVQDRRSSRWDVKWLLVIVCAHLLLALVYWHYTPFGAPPDEGPHGVYVEHLAIRHTFPVFDASYHTNLDQSDDGNYEFHQPPLYYLTGVPFYFLGRATGMGNPAEMVRLLSMLLGALSVVVIYRAIATAFPGRNELALACAGFVAFLPNHVMLSSSVSNDILAEVIFGLSLLAIAGILARGPSYRRAVGLGVVLGIGLLTKTTCILLLPVSVLAYLLVWQRGVSPAAKVAGHLGATLGVSLIVGSWWLARNQLLYSDPLALAQFQQAFQHTAKPEYWLDKGWSWSMYFALVGVWTFASFWGVFGHMNLFMPTWIYIAVGAVTIAALVASVRATAQLKAESESNRDILLVYGVTLALVLLAFIRFNIDFFQAQGRYLYPALVPISAFWVLGINQFLPARRRDLLPYLAGGIPAIVQIVALATCIIPESSYL